MTTLIVNYTELRFTSEVEMTRYLSQTEKIWNEKVMAMLLESGLQRKTVTQIWNQSDQFKLGIIWEYESPDAFKKCQSIIAEEILPHAQRFGMVAKSFRGVPVLSLTGAAKAAACAGPTPLTTALKRLWMPKRWTSSPTKAP